LATACIDASFEEILEEGYADDGLFPNMKEFFLPLTISEEELKMERSSINRQVRQNEVEVLNTKVQRLEELCREATTHRWHFDEQQTNMERTIEQAYTVYMNDRSQVDTETTSSARATELTQLDQQWKTNRMQLEQQLTEIKDELQQWITRVSDYEKQIDELNNQKHNIQTESSQPQRPVDKGLVKPARGFIMYGPPGKILSFRFLLYKIYFI
jgi:chromosome segregation ATPase